MDLPNGPAPSLDELADGGIVTLLGANGAGKRTTVRTIYGLTPCRKGTMEFDGTRIERLSADRMARLGVSLVTPGTASVSGTDVQMTWHSHWVFP